MRRLFCLLAATSVAMAVGQTLYSASEQATPGSAIYVVGEGLTTKTRFLVSSSRQGSRTLTASAAQASGSVAIVPLPPSLLEGVFKLTATNGRAASNALWINRPRIQWTDVDEVRVGGTIRVVGRNFRPTVTAKPTVRITNLATKKAYVPVVAMLRDTVAKLTIPPGTPPGRYRVTVDNGLGGAGAATFVVLPAAPDPFALGVAWGADLRSIAAKVYNAKSDPRLPAHMAGNGKTDDAQALAVILYHLKSHGGGVLDLPVGTYRVDNGEAWGVVYGGTVLRGAGRGKTILQVGYPYKPGHPAPDYHYALGISGGPDGPVGIADLTIENLNTADAPSGVLNGTGGMTSKVFLKRVEFRLGNGRGVTLSSPHQAVIADCEFHSTAPNGGGALRLDNVRDLQFVRNVDDHRAGRLALNYGERIVFEGNTVHFDNAYRNARSGETGGIEASFDQRFLLLDNEIGARGPQPRDRAAGDGEGVLSQYSQTGDLLLTGKVRSAGGRTVTPAEPLPGTPWLDGYHPTPLGPDRMAIFLVSGRGMGQWRRIASWTAGSLTVREPWQTTPDASSGFAIAPLNNFQHTYANNRIFGGFYGIEWEDGAVDSIAEGNVLTNTGFLGLLAYTADASGGRWGAPGSNRSFTAAWNNAFLRNTLVNSTGARPATISVCGFDLLNLNLGPLVLGTDVRGNTVIGNLGDMIPAQYGRVDGLEVISMNPNFPIVNNDVLVQGTVLGDNAISKSKHPTNIFNLTRGFLSNAPSLKGSSGRGER